MMQFFKNRQIRKQARMLRDGARKLLRIQRDILQPKQIEEVRAACNALDGALKQRDMAGIESFGKKLETQVERVFPRRSDSGIRENVEVLLVAAIVAMGVRTFFLQPFKIPTGSMQPTLYGVYPPPNQPPLSYEHGTPSIIERLTGTALFGHMYEPYGYRTRGDFIFVDKISYHFRKPKRGEVIVFLTDNIPDMSTDNRGKFFIKRLIGFAGDVLRIDPPHVYVNNQLLDSRPGFERIYSMKNGYSGYVNAPARGFGGQRYHLTSPQDEYVVPAHHFFPMGDNSPNSYDGRYWGSVPDEDLVGRAILVYWPFSRRFGLID